ncbi:ZIP family metal transporter [Lutibacter sp. A64]|uniref:ZIP family metal transporter n=1 Tax=Lutibacter sp. A64 TaxID=2918526 RepID=UPI001F063230|nr:ZIP family metal transporter [Lutibacter sp. A64]UMB54925.1 ZIP family metal transporter [Lutibacter sp. A64]
MTYIVLILSVLIGMVIVYGLKPNAKTVQLLLAFSGAYLLSITILHLFPEVYISDKPKIGLFILAGLLLQLILDFFSKGAEHGHIHVKDSIDFPWALFVSLGIHSFMEGIPLAHDHHHEHLLWAIVIHKIPIAVILGTFFVKSNISKFKAILFLLVFSLMSPLGTFAGGNIPFLLTYKTEITAIIIGVLLHISTIILFETSKDHKFNLYKFIAILIGMVVAYLA